MNTFYLFLISVLDLNITKTRFVRLLVVTLNLYAVETLEVGQSIEGARISSCL